MNNHKNNSGFTLIELMVTVAIVGIFASIALPSFAKLLENNRYTTITNNLVSTLHLARSEALKRRASVTVCPSSNQTSCNDNTDFSTGWIVFLDCNNDTTIDASSAGCGPNNAEEIIKVGEGFSSVYMVNQSVEKITFSFSGRLNGNPSTFLIGKSDLELKKQVVLSRIGRVAAGPYIE